MVVESRRCYVHLHFVLAGPTTSSKSRMQLFLKRKTIRRDPGRSIVRRVKLAICVAFRGHLIRTQQILLRMHTRSYIHSDIRRHSLSQCLCIAAGSPSLFIGCTFPSDRFLIRSILLQSLTSTLLQVMPPTSFKKCRPRHMSKRAKSFNGIGTKKSLALLVKLIMQSSCLLSLLFCTENRRKSKMTR